MHHPGKPFGGVMRALVEVAFIIFLFYANLLMGQYVRGAPRHLSLIRALRNIFTPDDLVIAVICAFVGHMLFDRLRRRL
jgi:hypothetical protein